MSWEIVNTDVLTGLRSLDAGSVQCCVTSPPYWGLRDYGTATWEGGDAACDHSKDRSAGIASSTLEGGKDTTNHQREASYRAQCRKCGAIRIDQQIGIERTPEEYVAKMVEVFREVRRVLRDDGTLWLNMGDGYAATMTSDRRMYQPTRDNDRSGGVAQVREPQVSPQRTAIDGLKPKDLIGMPWTLAFALRADGWWLRSEIIWAKKSPMPESVRDRPTKAHEQIFLLTKSARYFYDAVASAEESECEVMRGPAIHPDTVSTNGNGGLCRRPIEATRNMRSVWHLGPEPFTGWQETVHRVRVSADDADDGTTRITSPDCPLHGSKDHRATIRGRDEHEAGGNSRNPGTSDRPSQEQVVGSGSIDQSHASDSQERSSDSLLPGCSVSATVRSKRKSKTARVPATTQPCTASAGTAGCTGDTSASPVNASPCDRTRENNNGPDDSAAHLSGGTPAHIEGTFSISGPPKCTCEYYREITEKSSHFATFPTELVRKCLLAGTSEKGCCPECGVCWGRVVERERYEPELALAGERRVDASRGDKTRKLSGKDYNEQSSTKTTGWQPGCECGKEPVGCLVLDPFAGAGTTIMVARRLQCRAIGFELNPKYVAMAKKRIEDDAPLWNVSA